MDHETIDSCPSLSNDEDQESGWTTYFEDLSNQREESFCSSMVSDAASLPAWKSSQPNNLVPTCVSPNIPKMLTFKKTRTKEISHGDSLEDTASSPVNSPKVCDSIVVGISPRRATDDHFSTSGPGKGSISDPYGRSAETDKSCEMDNKGKNESTELKKRGLCLVPLSMLVNYLG